MSFISRLSKCFGLSSVPAAKKRGGARRPVRSRTGLRFETLEDRNLLSTLSVLNLNDSGVGSLRRAILDANANPGADTIQFAKGLHGTIGLTSGELSITGDLSIVGPGQNKLTVSGNNASRVFEIAAATVTITDLTIANGAAVGGDGGGILVDAGATLTVTGCTVSSNSAEIFGGGIANDGTATVSASTLSGNSAGFVGGGISNHGDGSTATVAGSTVSGNSAGTFGGGISNFSSSGLLQVSDSKLSGNSAHQGGGILNGGTMTVTGSKLSTNSAEAGGGILNLGTLTLTGTALNNNTATADSATEQVLGGGLLNNAGTATVNSCTFSGN